MTRPYREQLITDHYGTGSNNTTIYLYIHSTKAFCCRCCCADQQPVLYLCAPNLEHGLFDGTRPYSLLFSKPYTPPSLHTSPVVRTLWASTMLRSRGTQPFFSVFTISGLAGYPGQAVSPGTSSLVDLLSNRLLCWGSTSRLALPKAAEQICGSSVSHCVYHPYTHIPIDIHTFIAI